MKHLALYLALGLLSTLAIPSFASPRLDLEKAIVYREAGNYQEALQLFLQLSENGYVAAQMNLAEMYFLGQGLKKNNDTALYWACKASESKEIRAHKFRIKLALMTISAHYKPRKCSEILS